MAKTIEQAFPYNSTHHVYTCQKHNTIIRFGPKSLRNHLKEVGDYTHDHTWTREQMITYQEVMYNTYSTFHSKTEAKINDFCQPTNAQTHPTNPNVILPPYGRITDSSYFEEITQLSRRNGYICSVRQTPQQPQCGFATIGKSMMYRHIRATHNIHTKLHDYCNHATVQAYFDHHKAKQCNIVYPIAPGNVDVNKPPNRTPTRWITTTLPPRGTVALPTNPDPEQDLSDNFNNQLPWSSGHSPIYQAHKTQPTHQPASTQVNTLQQPQPSITVHPAVLTIGTDEPYTNELCNLMPQHHSYLQHQGHSDIDINQVLTPLAIATSAGEQTITTHLTLENEPQPTTTMFYPQPTLATHHSPATTQHYNYNPRPTQYPQIPQ